MPAGRRQPSSHELEHSHSPPPGADQRGAQSPRALTFADCFVVVSLVAQSREGGKEMTCAPSRAPNGLPIATYRAARRYPADMGPISGCGCCSRGSGRGRLVVRAQRMPNKALKVAA
jgi:hypothetical protein